MVVDREVGNEELLNQVKRDPKSCLLQNVGKNVIPTERVRRLVDVDRKKFVLADALWVGGVRILGGT